MIKCRLTGRFFGFVAIGIIYTASISTIIEATEPEITIAEKIEQLSENETAELAPLAASIKLEDTESQANNIENNAVESRMLLASEEYMRDTEIVESVNVCSTSDTKTYMDYHVIAEGSAQRILIDEMMHTGDDGLLYTEDGYIGVALGSYFGELGSKYIFILDTGIQLKLIKVEAKSDEHTVNGCYQKWDSSVIEFVLDEPVAANYWGRAENGYINAGNFNNVEQFRGSIVDIQKVYE